MTTIKLPHYLYQRGSIWWFRKAIPSTISRKDIRLSLKTSHLSTARSLALLLNNHYNRLINSHTGIHTMTENQLNFFQFQLRKLIKLWWQREMEDFHGDFDKGIEELNDLLHVATEQIEAHHIRIMGKSYRDNTKNKRIASKLLMEITDKIPDEENKLTDTDYQQLALMVDQASLQHYKHLSQYFTDLKPEWLSETVSITDAQFNASIASERILLSELIKKYQAENIEKEHSKKTQNKYAQCLALTISYFDDIFVDTITPEQGRHFREVLKSLPIGLKTKDMQQSPLHELIKKSGQTQTISVQTANSHLQKVSHFFDWGVSLGYLTQNPIPQEPLPTPRINHKDDRLVITNEEATKVFNHPIFTKHQGIKTKKIQQPYHFWLPLICLFTGMRPGEACQLYTNDIENVNGVMCIRIDNRYEQQRLKTPNAKRYIPIHQQLIELGFLVFVNDKTKLHPENRRLFPEIKLIQDSFATKPGEWFNRNLRDRQSLPDHVTLYSFRHYFRDKLLAQHPSDEYLNKIMGHQTSSYGSSLPNDQKAMKELINQLEYSSIVAQVLTYPNLAIFHSHEYTYSADSKTI